MNSPNGEIRGRGESVPAQEKVLAAARRRQSGAGRPESAAPCAAPAPRTQLHHPPSSPPPPHVPLTPCRAGEAAVAATLHGSRPRGGPRCPQTGGARPLQEAEGRGTGAVGAGGGEPGCLGVRLRLGAAGGTAGGQAGAAPPGPALPSLPLARPPPAPRAQAPLLLRRGPGGLRGRGRALLQPPSLQPPGCARDPAAPLLEGALWSLLARGAPAPRHPAPGVQLQRRGLARHQPLVEHR